MTLNRVLAIALTIAALGALAPSVEAQQPSATSVMPWRIWSPDNPYGKQIPEARQQMDAALAKLQAVITQDPFNFDAEIQAYYGYVRAEARLRALEDLANEWEATRQGKVAGRVLTLPDFDIWSKPVVMTAQGAAPPATAASAGDAAERILPPEFLRKGIPVAGAKVTLRPILLRAMDANTPKADAAPVTGGPDPRPQIWPGPPPPVYTATSGKDGAFRFEKNPPPANYGMTVTKDGFESWYGVAEVPSPGDANRTVYLSKFRSLLGTVTTIPAIDLPSVRATGGALPSTGSIAAERVILPPGRKAPPVSGAEVTLSPFEIPLSSLVDSPAASGRPAKLLQSYPVNSYSAKTDEQGRYRMKGMTAGRYTMRVSKDGLRSFEGTLDIHGTWQRQDIVLLPPFAVPLPIIEPLPLPQGRIEKPLEAPAGTTLDKPFGP